MPTALKPFFRLLNGATIFHTLFDLWGFREDQDDFRNPAIDIRRESGEITREWYPFGSSNSGDIVSISLQTGRIRLTLTDEGTSLEFSDINTWLVHEGDVGYEVFDK